MRNFTSLCAVLFVPAAELHDDIVTYSIKWVKVIVLLWMPAVEYNLLLKEYCANQTIEKLSKINTKKVFYFISL